MKANELREANGPTAPPSPSSSTSAAFAVAAAPDAQAGGQLALWLGTSTGAVLLVALQMPDNEDNRVLQLQSITAEPIRKCNHSFCLIVVPVRPPPPSPLWRYKQLVSREHLETRGA